ncbi:LicD family protein [Streptococcus suis]
MGKLTPETLRQLQMKTLEMSKYFVEFCKRHDITCYFCGGGCIGAIRHRGFIPWDDDLDFFIPRPDYERLKKLWIEEEHDSLELIFPSEDYNDHNIFMTLRDKDTTQIKPYQQSLDINHGVAIDIFPIDGAPSSKVKRSFQLFWALVYQIYCAQLVPTNYGKLVTYMGKILLKLVPSKTIKYQIWHFAEQQMSKYHFDDCDIITELCAGPRYMRNLYPKKAFEDSIFVEFEGAEMPIPKGYDVYLRIAFGNYMTLPPTEQQQSHHDAIFLDLNKSYIHYKGIYY